MHLHDMIFLGLAVVLIAVMLGGRDLLRSFSPARRAFFVPIRLLAKSRGNGRSQGE
jgi:hypothetical protein